MKDARHLDSGSIVAYRRNKIFHSRHRFDRYVHRSLKTDSIELAIPAAYRMHGSLEQQISDGLAVTRRSLNQAIDGYIALHEDKCRKSNGSAAMLRQIKRVTKFWREFAGNKPVDRIGNAELKSFIEWRRDYYSTHQLLPQNAKLKPKDKTLMFDLTIGRSVLHWANEMGWRGKQPMPTFWFKPTTIGVRPAFGIDEYRTLYKTMRTRIQKSPDARIKASREVLRDYVLILANSGLRVGELNNLTLRGVTEVEVEGRKTYKLAVTGKTGSRGDVVVRANAYRWVRRQLSRRLAQGAKSSDLLFVTSTGKRVDTFIDSFNEVLKEAGIVTDAKGLKYSLYSLRHFYAVQALRKSVPIYTLAKNMGTSVKMIELYYGKQATPEELAVHLAR